MSAAKKLKMSADEFLLWSLTQEGDYEFANGEIVAMSRDRKGHNVAKGLAFASLASAIRRAGLPYTPYTDGVAIKIPAGAIRRPDAAVDCGETFDPDGLELANPIILVEVVSASSEHTDTSTKLAEYFSIPSVAHYLIVMPLSRMVIHHARNADPAGPILTTLRRDGELRHDPPGLVLAVEDLFPPQMREPSPQKM